MPILASLAIAGVLADGPSVAIDWRAPEECPDAATVAEMTTTLLRARSAAQARLEVAATVSRAGGRYRLALALRSEFGAMQRELESDSCLMLARAVALVAAVHLDPIAVSQRLTSPPPLPPLEAQGPIADEPVESVPPTIDTTAPVVAGERAPGLSRRTDLSLPREPEPDRGGFVRVAGGLGYGTMPAVAGELALLGGAWGPRWRVEGGVTAAPEREVVVQSGALGGRFGRVAAVLRGCAVWRVPPRRESALLGCGGGEFGALAGIGTRGVDAPDRSWSPWLALIVGPAARVRLGGPVGLWLGIEAVIPLRRPTFTAGEAAQTLFRVGPAGVRAIVGIDVQIGSRKRRVRATE
jgi:hypothetical protein